MAIAALRIDSARTAARPAAVRGAGSHVSVSAVVRLTLALLFVGNLGRIPVFSVGVKDTPIMLNDLTVLAVWFVAANAAVRSGRLWLDRPAMLALAFAATGALSAALAIPRFGLSAIEFGVSIAYLIRWLFYFGVYLAVINFVRPGEVTSVWRTLERVFLLFAAFGIVQSLFLPGFAQVVFPNQLWDVQGHRLVSTFLDPNFAGGFIAVGLLILLAQSAYGVSVPLWKLAILFAALLLTISRSAALAFFAGVWLILWARGQSRRLLVTGTILTLLVLPFLPLIFGFANQFGRFSLNASAAARLLSWARGLEIFLDNPVLGIGFNTYGFVQRSYGWNPSTGSDFALDGGLLFIAVMTGLVGVALYAAMLWLVARRCRRVRRDEQRSGEERGLALGIAASTVALVVHSIFLNSLLYPLLMITLWALWGMASVLERRWVPPTVSASSRARARAGGSARIVALPVSR